MPWRLPVTLGQGLRARGGDCAAASVAAVMMGLPHVGRSWAGGWTALRRLSTAPRRVYPARANAAAPAAAAAAAVASDAESAAAVASTSSGGRDAPAAAAAASLAEMRREVPGGSQPLQSWEKYYWGGGVTAVALGLYWYMRPKPKSPEELEAERVAAAARREAQQHHVRGLLMRGAHFIEGGEDPLDGMSPAQIEELIQQAGIDVDDPYEGMSPEEIDAFVAKQEAAKAAAAGQA